MTPARLRRSSRRLALPALAVALAAPLAACGSSSGGGSDSGSAVTVEGDTQVVHVTGTARLRFVPDRVEVSPGKVRVEFTVPKGSAPHSFTIRALDVDTGVFDDDTKSVSFTVSQPGTYTYICTIHASMTGTLVVK